MGNTTKMVEDQERQFATIRKGNKDIEEGRTISHEKMSRWLRSWGKKRVLPPPSCE
jgi:predicted transcriptional regulator